MHYFLQCFTLSIESVYSASDMGKKRKAGGRAFGSDGAKEIFEGDSELRINTYEDVANSEDEFHINRDKILLQEGPAQKRQRKIRGEGEEHIYGKLTTY